MRKTVTGLLLCAVAAGSMALGASTAAATTAGHGPYRSADVHPMVWGFYSVYNTYENCENAGKYLETVGIARAHYCEFNNGNPRYPWNLYIDYI